MVRVQKPDFVFRRNGRGHLNRWGRQFSRLPTAEVCASAVVMLDTPCSEVAWRVLATHSIRQFPLHFPFHASPCAITFQLESTTASDHTHRESVGLLWTRVRPRHRGLYLTTHNAHKKHTSLPPVGFEPAIPASQRRQTYALECAATGIGGKLHTHQTRTENSELRY